MRPLTDQQVEILTSCRDSGERIVVAARAAGMSSSRVSKWCRVTGIPWPRGDYRRGLRNGRAAAAGRDEALAALAKTLSAMTSSPSPAVAQFAVSALSKLRDHDVTTVSQSCGDVTSSGVLIRSSKETENA